MNSRKKRTRRSEKKVFNSEYEDSARIDTAKAEENFIFRDKRNEENLTGIRRKLDLNVSLDKDKDNFNEEFRYDSTESQNSKIVKIKLLDENYLSTKGLILQGTKARVLLSNEREELKKRSRKKKRIMKK